jgi:hypothetical protein
MRRNAARLEELPPELEDEPPPPPPPPDDELDEPPPPPDELEEELEDDELELDEELDDEEEELDDDELDDEELDDEELDDDGGVDDELLDGVDDDEPVGDVGLSLVVQPVSSPTPARATPPESKRRNWRRSALRASAAPSAFRETKSVMYGLLADSKTSACIRMAAPLGSRILTRPVLGTESRLRATANIHVARRPNAWRAR